MLQHTFVHVPGVGRSTESALWESGARHWDEFGALRTKGQLQGGRYESVAAAIDESRAALKRKDPGPGYFWRSLPNSEHWRLFEEFVDLAAFVDIETTGLSSDADEITVVAMCANNTTHTFVLGKDLDRFPEAVAKYPLVVTFNGACFDLPFLARKFRGYRPPAHVDLRYPLKRLGYSGGLKSVERQAGVKRPTRLQEVDGWEAVRLWHAYKRGDKGALDLLLEYARADVENLAPLARLVATRLASELGFPRRTCMWGGLSAR
ncbi:MAG: hypothetical protein A2133_07240 [Actinobacteria bacterium RBG_16_64_13]|nr:MAG: hypothetical protein A2133_07240 [Actinobacteria bacterium RBG_16_64_13]